VVLFGGAGGVVWSRRWCCLVLLVSFWCLGGVIFFSINRK
jgi:hypothetical protein